MAARPVRPFTAIALLLAFASVASCAAGGGGGAGALDDPDGVNEHVREIVARFSYGDSGPYASTGDSDAFGGDSGGPFEGPDSPGLIGPPSAASGAYERTNSCDAYCSFVASCLNAEVPSNCASACSSQMIQIARRFGDGCVSPLFDLYACLADVLVCNRSGGEDGEPSIEVSSDLLNRCSSAIESFTTCINRPGSDLDDVFDDDDDGGSGGGGNGGSSGNGGGGSNSGGGSGGD